MDNDSAHHANIALRMHLTGDYINLIDYGKDYLDKPHLHFWLCALSYKIFGVTTFAYKFPSLLFSILGIYSTYRLGKALYTHETGKLAALILASSFAFILANNDVRMDAILTSCIAFSCWHLTELIQTKKIQSAVFASFGFALGFANKGHIDVFVPAVAALFYIIYRKEWSLFWSWKWLILLVMFAIFISPVVYCYYLQYNLHPEKVVRGKDHIDGVSFILFNQSVERFSGEMGSDAKNDYLFFIHSFLWAFAPWSILAYIAIFGRLKTFLQRKEEWLTTGVFIVVLLIVSFSGFKLPHYLNVVFPTTSVLTAAFILTKQSTPAWQNRIYLVQLIISILLLVLITALTFWAFPIKLLSVIAGVIIFLAIYFYFLKTEIFNRMQKAVCLSVAAITLCFFILNTNFYPQLLKYQGGNELAFATKNKINPRQVYFWEENYSSSYNFYTSSLRKPYTDSVRLNNRSAWLLFDVRDEENIKSSGITLGERFSTLDYEITKLDIKFVDPKRRESQCTQLVLARIE